MASKTIYISLALFSLVIKAFTRSHLIMIPNGIDYVVVRGHDQTHGYGGQAIVLELSTGVEDKINQGTEPQDFSGYGS